MGNTKIGDPDAPYTVRFPHEPLENEKYLPTISRCKGPLSVKKHIPDKTPIPKAQKGMQTVVNKTLCFFRLDKSHVLVGRAVSQQKESESVAHQWSLEMIHFAYILKGQ